MNKKYPWLPFDERLIPDIFSFKYPKSPLVRGMLFLEMLFATLAVVGTLVLVILPKSASTPNSTQASSINTPQTSPSPAGVQKQP